MSRPGHNARAAGALRAPRGALAAVLLALALLAAGCDRGGGLLDVEQDGSPAEPVAGARVQPLGPPYLQRLEARGRFVPPAGAPREPTRNFEVSLYNGGEAYVLGLDVRIRVERPPPPRARRSGAGPARAQAVWERTYRCRFAEAVLPYSRGRCAFRTFEPLQPRRQRFAWSILRAHGGRDAAVLWPQPRPPGVPAPEGGE